MTAGVVRPATAADVPAFARIWVAAVRMRAVELGIDEPLDVVEFEAVVREQFAGPAFPVVRIETAPTGIETAVAIGIGRLALDGDGSGRTVVPGLAHLSMIAVAPKRWGEGHGQSIVSALLREARDRGYEQAQLWVQEANDRARALYFRMGFRPAGRTMESSSGPIGLWQHVGIGEVETP